MDLGRSSESIARAWEHELRCPVVRLESFRRSIDDPRAVGQILRPWRGRLIDREGLDWWELTSLFIHAELEIILAMQRLAPALPAITELRSTRRGWTVAALEFLLGRQAAAYARGNDSSLGSRLGHYSRLLRRFSFGQLAEIFLDKHDSDFRWRSRLTPQRRGADQPVVLLPSAYTNVSRMATAYARLVPELQFLLVYTRRSGKQFTRPANVSLVSLAAYAGRPGPEAEFAKIRQDWISLKRELERCPEMELLSRLGLLDPFDSWLSDGLTVRDAWLELFRREPVQAVLCGDDSNWYTRLPVVLARKRGLPTIDFHHGALDGRFLLKDLPSDIYLAKSEMELDYLTRVCTMAKDRIVIGSPDLAHAAVTHRGNRTANSIVFFSEPYEATGGRAEEVYRELLPPLATLAATSNKKLIVKLHPFESRSDRERLLRQILSVEQQQIAGVVVGPLTQQLLEEAWFGITVESTTVIECAMQGVPCFIAGWMVNSPYGYVQQYSAFGLGVSLLSVEQVPMIPSLLLQKGATKTPTGGLWQPIEPAKLRWLLAGEYRRELARSSHPLAAEY